MDSDAQIYLQLQNLLSYSKIDHRKEILNCKDIKSAHIYCKINHLPGPIFGSLIERYILQKFQMKRNVPSENNGDVQYNGTNYEIKSSLGGKKNEQFNFVQLRPNNLCDYLLFAYHLSVNNIDSKGELYIFKLSREQMKQFILKYGTYAHGTRSKNGPITNEDLDNTSNVKEYVLRPKYGDVCWNELCKYRCTENLFE